mgnify:CR=1 FL=1
MDAMQQELKAFKDPALARGLIESIQALAPESATLMEVCGTHTVAIARNGIRGLMPEGVRLASGPGCPVCVTSNHDIDKVIALARVPEVTIATFGDMTRVPGSTSSLLAEQAAGRAVEIVYSPLDALRLAPIGKSSSSAWASKPPRRWWLWPSSGRAPWGSQTSPCTAPTRTCPGRWRSSSMIRR